MGKCEICRKEKIISKSMGVCLECIRERPEKSLFHIREIHKKIREKFNLPTFPPESKDGIECNICDNRCKMANGEKGYCGLRENENGILKSKVNSDNAFFDCYYDPIPTNCCAGWFCGAEKEGKGLYNLAVFFYGCSFNCLFCQNYSHKFIERAPILPIEQLVKKANKDSVYCICFFGGSPEPQLPFVIKFSEEILNFKKLRICFEWNGNGNEKLVRKIGEIVLKTGGIIKFDLKAFDENLNIALTGVSNKKTYENFEIIAKEFFSRADYPVLTATTLLVPGYIDGEEIEKISKFISDLNPEIPYSLLVFFPEFYMNDLHITSKETVYECYKIAKKYLKNVHIGNLHLFL